MGGRVTSSAIFDMIMSRTTTAEGCLNWTGATDRFGYGLVTVRGMRGRKTWTAHRLSYCAFNEVMLPRLVVVRHSCDNPTCVNPCHLRAGTQKDNVADMHSRGRYAPHGEATGRKLAALSDSQAVKVAELRRSGVTARNISSLMGVSVKTVYRILSGKRYKWVKLNT